MAEEQANVAPAETKQATESEANSTNSNQAEATNTLTLTPEQEKIISANGGFEKFFNAAKSAISNPVEKKEEAKTEQPAQQPAQQPEQQAPAQTQQPAQQPVQQTREGVLTQSALMARQYFNSLASMEEYKGLAKELRDGTMVKELSNFGIDVYDDQGNFNDARINQYLQLRAKTIPAQPDQTPAANSIPTVDYVETGESITSYAEAMAVINQSASLSADKRHPKYQEAYNFILGKKPGDNK